jgi:hypothetical protein
VERQTESWIESFRAVHTRAVKLLSARNIPVWLSQGKVYNTPGWSDKYVTELAASVDGCAVLAKFVDALAAGDPVPIKLMDRHVPGDLGVLQLIDGQLYEVLRKGRRQPVNGYLD